MTLGNLVKLARKHVRGVAGIILLGVSAGVAVAMFMTPVYRATSVLAPVADQGSRSTLTQLAGDLGRWVAAPGLGGGTALKAEAVATLQSHGLAQKFIQERHLLPILFADRWDPVRKTWNDDEPTLNEAVELWLEDLLSVSEDRRTGLVTVTIDWSDPSLAAEWSNGVVAATNAQLRAAALQESRRAMQVLEGELSGTGVVGVQQGIYRLIESNMSETVSASVREDYAFRVVDPAVAADSDDFIRPQRALLIVFGLMFGLSLAGLFLSMKAQTASQGV